MQCPCQQCSSPQGPSSFPLTKKITAKFSPDHLLAKKQQCWSSPQCLFILTQKDSSSYSVPVSFNNLIAQNHVQWKAAAGVPMPNLPVQNCRNSFYFLHFSPKEYTNCYIWLFLQQLWLREAKDISESVLPELLPPLWLCGLMDYPLKQNWTDAKLYPRVKSTLDQNHRDINIHCHIGFHFVWSLHLTTARTRMELTNYPNKEPFSQYFQGNWERWNQKQHRKNFLFKDFCACLKPWPRGAKTSGSSCRVTFQMV